MVKAYNQPVYIFLFHAEFILDDVMVSRSLRQAIDIMNPELPDTPGAGALSKLTESVLHIPENTGVSVPTAAVGVFSQLQQSSVNETESKEVSVIITAVTPAARALCKLEQSPLHDAENKEVSVPTAARALSELEQASLHGPENKEMPVHSAASVVSLPNIIDSLKSVFRVRKEVNKIKISVTQEKFLKKSWKVGKKKLHQRKIVPVMIWDFGGQDVFYSTHQTFLTYRAIYMLVLDGVGP
jgi:hypothetical protein